jgi:transposase
VKRERRTYLERMAEEALPQLKFFDESGVNLGMTRLYGRAAPGERVIEGTPGLSGEHYTVLAAVGLEGLSAPLVLPGAVNGTIFETYVRDLLGPTLQPGDRLILDNLPAHKVAGVREAVEARGAELIYLPPYSADFNPIEQCWGKLKQALRTAKARTFDALLDALAQALRSIAPADILAWFQHCGYAINP